MLLSRNDKKNCSIPLFIFRIFKRTKFKILKVRGRGWIFSYFCLRFLARSGKCAYNFYEIIPKLTKPCPAELKFFNASLKFFVPKQMKKTERIHVRLTTDEKELLQKKAEKLGLSLSEYFRNIAVTKEPIFIDNSLFIQIQKIGYNVNQIVRNSHATKTPPSENLIKEIEDLKSIIQNLNNETIKIK